MKRIIKSGRWLVGAVLWMGFCTCPVLAAMTSADWLKEEFSVEEVLSGQRLAIDYKGLKTAVVLAHVEEVNVAKSTEFLKNLIGTQEVILLPDTDMGLDPNGLPQVYVFMKQKEGNLFINLELLRQGLVKYVPGETVKFKKFRNQLEALAQTIEPPSDFKEGGIVFYSELHSKRYCRESCKWVKQMNKQSRIAYDTFESAEKAEKSPCSLCLYDRVKELRSQEGRSNVVGSLIGLKTDNFFYSPVAKVLADVQEENVVRFDSLADALASGRKPDPSSLRIDNPVVPAAVGDECCGRGLPFFRPCRRPTDHPTKLCKPCLNGIPR